MLGTTNPNGMDASPGNGFTAKTLRTLQSAVKLARSMHCAWRMNAGRAIQEVVYSTTLKPVVWLGSSRAVVHAFPRLARRAIGRDLMAIQRGFQPTDSKPMSSVGSGVVELRVHTGGEFRVIYVAKHVESVYVLHAFEKRTQRTRQGDIELARARLRGLAGTRRALC